ncbi:aminotransferase class V-fold PLP-dependent enzyme [Paenibacillus glycanilyticus]|uniref:aminotransferase class V-fold PLP-dependent enzyme n=1 Tax=Paenibacillus glycanilyticus TaxID=126569 RepID=UPI000FDCC93C|nr:aminotransferase class V-fold PLP-dependent enzyme [Paenibacillus glycanilyticus]
MLIGGKDEFQEAEPLLKGGGTAQIALKSLVQWNEARASNHNLPQVSVLSFTIEGLHHQDIAQFLAKEAGISVRSGFFCAYPYVQKLLRLSDERLDEIRKDPVIPSPGLVRISLSFYNTSDEVDRLIMALQQITSNKEFYMNKYADVQKGICGGR